MRNHTAYVICFVQELIRSSNTGCQVVSVREPGGADPRQPQGHGPFPAGQPGMGGAGAGASGGTLRRALGQKNSPGWFCPVPCQVHGVIRYEVSRWSSACPSLCLWTPGLCEGAGSADSVLPGNPWNSWSCVTTSASLWEPVKLPPRMRG